ncbi:MAG: aromatic ring-hydroxylating dioxygenase subunit alpha [Burkholderiaceae bacterium]|nr:MAG: aromatic ring-hydroxylating dioxygenase subunit alpha [Burkholderiaceae bacterium]TAM02120.1 MAG: aromatic ring-hydroxylating dioxygenase subunit alpha [Pusillimonas sp.]
MFLKNDWYMAAWAAEVGSAPVARRICNEPMVLYRDAAGSLAALQDRCCHRGVALSLGKVIEEGIQCGYHGIVFDAKGQCVHIPGQDRIPAKAVVHYYAVHERDSIVWVWMGNPDEADLSLIVDYPYHGDVKNWPHREGLIPVKCNYEMLIDNIMDLTHLPYVHTKTIGGGTPTNVHSKAVMKTERMPRGVKYSRWLLDSVPPPTYAKAIDFPGKIDRWQEEELLTPSVIIQFTGGVDTSQRPRETGNREGGFGMRVLHCIVPETETSCHYFFSVSNGFGQDDPANTDLVYDQVYPTLLEDKVFCENQQAIATEFPDENFVDIRSDEARILYHQHLDERLANEKKLAKRDAAVSA